MIAAGGARDPSPVDPGHLLEEVLPGVWRWPDGAGTDRCGTALATADGLVLVDPPALADAARRRLEVAAGAIRHVVLTAGRLAGLAAPYRSPRVAVRVGGRDRLPGGLIACPLPGAAGEVALLVRGAGGQDGGGLLLTGDALRVVGQTPVYREGDAPPIPAYLETLQALRALEPAALAPAHQTPALVQVVRATAWAAGLEHPRYRERAAPVQGPRFLVLEAARVLDEASRAPVVLRRAGPPLPALPGSAGAPGEAGTGVAGVGEAWLADPFACSGCGRPNAPLRQTCSGPGVPRLCAACRAAAREHPAAARLLVCEGGCCTRYGARAVASAARQALAARDSAARVEVVPVRCIGRCALGPYVRAAAAGGEEPAGAAAYRAAAAARARAAAAGAGLELDGEAEANLRRFAPGARPHEMDAYVGRLVADLQLEPAAPRSAEPPG